MTTKLHLTVWDSVSLETASLEVTADRDLSINRPEEMIEHAHLLYCRTFGGEAPWAWARVATLTSWTAGPNYGGPDVVIAVLVEDNRHDTLATITIVCLN